MLMPQHNQKSF